MKCCFLWLVVMLPACVMPMAHAQNQPDSQAQQAKTIAAAIQGDDPQAAQLAVKDIHALVQSDPEPSVGYLHRYWLGALVSKGKFEEADELALEGILAAPWRTGDVEALEERRTRIWLAAGKAKEALSHAHSLFNVVSLQGTERALILLTECDKAVHGEDVPRLKRWRTEQIRGATTRPVDQVEPTSSLVLDIPIDGSPYGQKIEQMVSDDEQTLLGKGNLLLLAGRPKEARTVFQSLVDAGGDKNLNTNVARAIRAEDGTVGRANGYMLDVYANR